MLSIHTALSTVVLMSKELRHCVRFFLVLQGFIPLGRLCNINYLCAIHMFLLSVSTSLLCFLASLLVEIFCSEIDTTNCQLYLAARIGIVTSDNTPARRHVNSM